MHYMRDSCPGAGRTMKVMAVRPAAQAVANQIQSKNHQEVINPVFNRRQWAHFVTLACLSARRNSAYHRIIATHFAFSQVHLDSL